MTDRTEAVVAAKVASAAAELTSGKVQYQMALPRKTRPTERSEMAKTSR